ncbi:YkgJ family cysteine cluster protein [Lachnoclostridium phytofermentans]|uniref:YkgJ family cysteine cluster protein n=1 Tax=Lachnoclostridium phytofermentans TaxID=66219 RepID=UPI00049670B8|nr:YkgJ family cysteine cluster protein [Lachnoclostridium phytofermentans]
MDRKISLSEISDGKLYGLNDMVKAGCNDCKGCSACCKGMGNSIILDPFDIFRLTTNRRESFEELLHDKIELNMVDGVILPNLKMVSEVQSCAFLNEEGRCSIHAYRPGICRIFPLGRYYENHSYHYILQIHECKNKNRSKVKVSKWIDTNDVKRNEQFILDWHYFLKNLQEQIKKSVDNNWIRNINLYLLNTFYQKPYVKEQNFYLQFEERFEQVKRYLETNKSFIE